jgi:hypothetical protein
MRTNTQEAVLCGYRASIIFALRPRWQRPRGAHPMCAERRESERRATLLKTPSNFADSRTRSIACGFQGLHVQTLSRRKCDARAPTA